MRKCAICAGVLCGMLLLVLTGGNATQFQYEYFALEGYGSFMDEPPIFSGDIIGGTLSPGTFWVKFDDTGWPQDDPGTPEENERLDYILSHYFTYDDTEGSECWDGVFPPSGSSEPKPTWRFYTDAGDTVGGLCTGFVISIRDFDADSIVDDNEYQSKQMSTNLIAYINFGGGCYESWCGHGNFHGDLDLIDEETWEEKFYVPSASSASGILIMQDDGCNVGVDDSTWGKIKSLYE
jgi:hypothetical protein